MSLIRQNHLTFSAETQNLIRCPFFFKPVLCPHHVSGQSGLIPIHGLLRPIASRVLYSDKLDFCDCKEQLTTEVKALRSSATGCGPNFQIRFSFSCNFARKVIAATLHSDKELQIRETDFLPKSTASVDFNLQQLLCKEEALKSMEEQIKDWPVWPGGRRQLVEFFWTKARDAVESLPAYHDTLCLEFDTIVTHIHRYAYKYLPGDCSICLEEFDELSQVYCLPCSHQFHIDCISKWITKSSKNLYCPLCRLSIIPFL